MGQARERWDAFVEVLQSGDVGPILELYAEDANYLEPANPPHFGNLLIQAYLKDWLGAKAEVTVTVKRVLESDDGTTLAVEWAFSYTAQDRRWNNLPRASWFEIGDQGRIAYHRDY